MRLFVSAVLVAAGAIMIAAVDGSVRGVEANTIGAVLVLLGLVTALVMLVVRASRGGFTASDAHEEDHPTVLPRR
jgi:hypothetical protein